MLKGKNVFLKFKYVFFYIWFKVDLNYILLFMMIIRVKIYDMKKHIAPIINFISS